MRRAAALSVAVLAVAGVALAQPSRRHVRPNAQILTASASAGVVRFSLRVSFAAPTGIRGSSACRGRVVVRADGRRWSGRLGGAMGGCGAPVAGSLPATRQGRRVWFRIRFGGNRVVAPFSVRRHLRVSAVRLLHVPPPPVR